MSAHGGSGRSSECERLADAVYADWVVGGSVHRRRSDLGRHAEQVGRRWAAVLVEHDWAMVEEHDAAVPDSLLVRAVLDCSVVLVLVLVLVLVGEDVVEALES